MGHLLCPRLIRRLSIGDIITRVFGAPVEAEESEESARGGLEAGIFERCEERGAEASLAP